MWASAALGRWRLAKRLTRSVKFVRHCVFSEGVDSYHDVNVICEGVVLCNIASSATSREGERAVCA